jgi:predicted SprT family Zn-dependent metalloprotease
VNGVVGFRAAGVCKFSGGGGCEIRLSEPVLKSRTTAELKTTLLHEMIHAYLFSMSGNKDHDDHGPCFQHLMRSINQCSADDDQVLLTTFMMSGQCLISDKECLSHKL